MCRIQYLAAGCACPVCSCTATSSSDRAHELATTSGRPLPHCRCNLGHCSLARTVRVFQVLDATCTPSPCTLYRTFPWPSAWPSSAVAKVRTLLEVKLSLSLRWFYCLKQATTDGPLLRHRSIQCSLPRDSKQFQLNRTASSMTLMSSTISHRTICVGLAWLPCLPAPQRIAHDLPACLGQTPQPKSRKPRDKLTSHPRFSMGARGRQSSL
jgi:hypothetical protein